MTILVNKMSNLKKYKQECDEKYYDEGIQIISDSEYDILNEYIENEENLDNKETATLIPAKAGKIKLPIQMWSLNKCRRYDKKIDCTIMDKLDGVSCLIHNKHAYTRGNGIYGYDITEMIKPTPDIENYAIRGELIIQKEIFEKKYSSLYSNCRTMVCAFVHRNLYNPDIEFVAYELISLSSQDHDINKQMEILKQHNIQTVYYKNFKNIGNDDFEEILEHRNINSLYEIDGIVVSPEGLERRSNNLTGNPKYTFAYKKNIRGIVTNVIDIEWSVNRSAIFVPVIHISPVNINGTIIKRISGHNLNYLKSRGIGINSRVEVIKSGQIIPFIIDVLETSDNFNIPEDCDDEGRLISESSQDDSRIMSKKILFFCKTLGVYGVGPKTSIVFFENGITPMKIIEQGTSCLNFLNKGLQNNKILKSLTDCLQNCSQEQILIASGILGIGIGLNNIKKIDYMSEKSCLEIIKLWKQNWRQTVENKLKNTENTKNTENDKTTNSIENNTNTKLACISGSRNKDVENIIKNKGFEITYNLTKKVHTLFVVKNDKTKNSVKSTKIEKCEKNNINIEYLYI